MAKKEIKMTIDKSLFDTIQLLRRVEDAAELTTITGYSRPTIDKALNFGNIKSVKLERLIVDYYSNRATEQKENAKKILNKIINAD